MSAKERAKLPPTFLPVEIWVSVEEKPAEHNLSGKISRGDATTVVNYDDGVIYVYFEKKILESLKEVEAIGLITHEAYHVVEFTYQLVGEEEHGSEMTAYYLQFIVCLYCQVPTADVEPNPTERNVTTIANNTPNRMAVAKVAIRAKNTSDGIIVFHAGLHLLKSVLVMLPIHLKHQRFPSAWLGAY